MENELKPCPFCGQIECVYLEKIDKEKNKVVITGCNNCPFLKELLLSSECLLDNNINVYENGIYNDFFPKDCPLRNPNFKLIRKLE